MKPEEIIAALEQLYQQGLSKDKKSLVADLIRKLRHVLGLSMRQFGAALKTAPQTIDRWERGSSLPSLCHLTRLKPTFVQNASDPTHGPALNEHELVLTLRVRDEVALQIVAELQKAVTGMKENVNLVSLSIRPIGRMT
ncbi:MAG: helix-turn-helix domain-containing protein [Candidatus Doudnabacteria bacterium]|nr:helix-turn-helix domain-containing protein [Candidatus Doudnabacteria bacterium]